MEYSKELLEQAGSKYKEKCKAYIKKHGKLLKGTACYTKAGNLECDYVIHVNGSSWDKKYDDEDVKLIIKSCIRSAL